MAIIPADDFSPIMQGDTGNPFNILVIRKDGSVDSILGATITMSMQNVDTLVVKTCTGPWVIDPADNGKASYQYQAGDVDTAGLWKMWVKVVIAGRPIHPDDGQGNPKVLEIKPLPVGV